MKKHKRMTNCAGWVLAAIVVMGFAQGQTIGVNFEQYTPRTGTLATESALVGPAGGLGTEWNQFADEDSSGPLVDSTGALTTVEFATNFSEGRSGGGSNTPMLRSTLTDFGRGAERAVTITGLEGGGSYDIWLSSYRDSSAARERTVGVWTTPNATDSASSQIIDNRDGRNGTTFVEGYNYIVFRNVKADPSGTVIFNGNGADQGEGYDDDYRLGLSGLQITPGTTLEPLEITDLAYEGDDGQITLTWRSNPGESYGIYWSDDLVEFSPGLSPNIAPEIPAHPTNGTTTYGPFSSPSPSADQMFFRVGPPDQEDPLLERLWGNDTTIYLSFSEKMLAGPATNLSNFTVAVGGDALIFLSNAELINGGTTVALTTGIPLSPDIEFMVGVNNLTDLAGRPVANATGLSFRTWDDDPSGVKVFILAGQSNMQGHGRNEIGLGGAAGGIGSLRYLVTNYDAGSAPLPNYGRLVDGSENWVPRTDVKVWWRDSELGAPRAVEKGNLLPSFGVDAGKFGPEYGFGWVLGDHYDEPVLLIKTAWGGKSLNSDFRPPSAVAARGGEVGPYYLAMVDHVREVLENLSGEFPEWAGQGYQIAGFGWHQGWNDRVTGVFAAAYEANLVDFINDVRLEFGNPELPFSIATTGMAPNPNILNAVEAAQLAVADAGEYPAFAGTVKTVDARPFWRAVGVSPANQGFHWNQNGETYYLLGDAMGTNMVEMLTP